MYTRYLGRNCIDLIFIVDASLKRNSKALAGVKFAIRDMLRYE